jgi:hypothetical protein
MIDSTHRGARPLPHRRTGFPIFRTLLSRLSWAADHTPTLLLALLAALCPPTLAPAQSGPTASRVGDLQLGAGFVFAHSGYNFTPIHLLGGAGYIDFAKRPHWGGEFIFHQTKDSADSTVYERTYEIGPRIFVHRGPFVPYAKLLYGRGVYNFHNNVANVAYNIATGGGGLDFAIRPSINLRADYEYQTWFGFPIANLHPSVITLGLAYHFHE